jgi:thiamine pyrophosphate-dependent acetolactate synthase large subunit-like protein
LFRATFCLAQDPLGRLTGSTFDSRDGIQLTEADVFRILLDTSVDEAIVVANGYLSREAFSCRDSSTNFYMLGSMGLALSIGLGVALAQPRRRVVVIDGDGNLLMSLGTLTTVGYMGPPNLMHVVIDNQQYASTGGQGSISGSVRMAALALAAGYRTASEVNDQAALFRTLEDMRAKDGPSFLRALVSASFEIAPRVTRLPDEIARTFKESVTA